MANPKTVTLPAISNDRVYVSLARVFSHLVIIEDEDVSKTFTVDPSKVSEAAADSAFETGYRRYIYPGTINAKKDGTKLDAVQRKQDNFLSDDFVASTGGLTPWESEGKKFLVAFIRERIPSVKDKKGLSEKWYTDHGGDPEKAFRAVCDEVAGRMPGADSQIIFDKNWPTNKGKIEERVAIVEENAKRLRALKGPASFDLDEPEVAAA